MKIIISTDEKVINVNGDLANLAPAAASSMPATDPNWRVIRSEDRGGAMIEVKDGSPIRLSGQEADDLLAPFFSAHASETARLTALEAPTLYKRLRQAAYPPVGDQLDVILKQFEKLRADGTTMLTEMDDLLAAWLQVKADYPESK